MVCCNEQSLSIVVLACILHLECFPHVANHMHLQENCFIVLNLPIVANTAFVQVCFLAKAVPFCSTWSGLSESLRGGLLAWWVLAT